MSSIPRELAKGSFLRVMHLTAQVGVFFFLTPYIIRSLGDQQFGLWTIVGSIIGYYGMLDLGLSSAVNRFMAVALGQSNEEESERVLSVALVCFVGLGLLVLVLGAGLAACAGLILDDPVDARLFRIVVLILTVHLASDFPVRAYSGILTAHMRFDVLSALQVLSLVLRTVLVVFALSRGYAIVGLALATLLSVIPERLILIRFARQAPPQARFRRELWSWRRARELISYSGYSLAADLGNLLRFNLDYLVVAGFLSVAAVTHYRVASVMVLHFVMVVGAVIGVLFPIFPRLWASGETEKMRDILLLSTKLSVCLSSFVAFGLVAWGRPFLIRWVGDGYVDAYPVLVLLALASMVDLWQTPTVGLLYGISQHRFYAIFNPLEGVANLGLSLLLVGRYGMLGVAAGTLVPSVIVRLFVQPYYLSRVSGIRYGAYVLEMSRAVAVAALGLVVPSVLAIAYGAPNYVVLTSLGLVSAFLFTLVVGFVAFTSDERSRILSAFGLRRSGGGAL